MSGKRARKIRERARLRGQASGWVPYQVYQYYRALKKAWTRRKA